MSIRFDEAADRVTHAGSVPVPTSGITVTAWVKIVVDRDYWSTWCRIFNASGSTVITASFSGNGTAGPGYYTSPASAEIPRNALVGVWYPVAVSHDVGGTTGKAYVRDTGVTYMSSAVGVESSTPAGICIGGRDTVDASEWLNGEVAQVRVWAGELTQAEIETEWASPAPVRTSDLWANWPLANATDLTDTVAGRVLGTSNGTGQTTGADDPSQLRANLCPNPSADVDVTGWGGSGPVRVTGLTGLPKPTGVKFSGYGSLRTPSAAVTPGTTYSVSWWGVSNVSAALGLGYLVWYDSGGADLSYQSVGAWPGAAGVAARQSYTMTAPVGAVAVGVIQDGGPDSILSGVLVETGAVVHAYADGDSPGWRWTGTPGNSPSAFGAGGPSAWTATITDGLGLTDAASRTAGYVQALTDGLGSTDSASRTAAAVRALSDGLGAVDSATRTAAYAPTITDPLGAVDSASRVATYARSTSDALGAVDQLAIAAAFGRSVSDGLGLLDALFADSGPAPSTSGPEFAAAGVDLVVALGCGPGVDLVPALWSGPGVDLA